MNATAEKVAHTPGPWTLDPEYPDEIIAGTRSIGEVRGGRWVGDCASPMFEVPAEVAANARLIAAAPEMLKTLISIFHVCNDISDGKGENNLAVIRAFRAVAEAAIRKAKGEAA